MQIFGFSSDKIVTAVVACFFGLVAFDGERALSKLDEVYNATQANSTQIGINKAAIEVVAAHDADHETRLRVVEHEIYVQPKPSPTHSIPLDFKLEPDPYYDSIPITVTFRAP